MKNPSDQNDKITPQRRHSDMLEVRQHRGARRKALREEIRFKFHDLGTGNAHALDFKLTRATYLRTRFVALCFFLAISVSLWIFVDYGLLAPEYFLEVSASRLMLSSFLVLLALFSWSQEESLSAQRLALVILVVIVSSFYIWSQVVTSGVKEINVTFGYALFPFIIIALLSIFPLSFAEGLVLSSLAQFSLAAKHLLYGTLFTTAALLDFWLITILLGVMFWVQLGQLAMLLRLYRQAARDPMTGLYNRRFIVRKIENFRNFSEGEGALLFCDLDLLRRINDHHGHYVGDLILQDFSLVLKFSSRKGDFLGRYGGQEFFILLPGAGLEGAALVAERIRSICQRRELELSNGDIVRYTTSIGMAVSRPGEGATDFISRADDCLYSAKKAGRNCIYPRV